MDELLDYKNDCYAVLQQRIADDIRDRMLCAAWPSSSQWQVERHLTEHAEPELLAARQWGRWYSTPGTVDLQRLLAAGLQGSAEVEEAEPERDGGSGEGQQGEALSQPTELRLADVWFGDLDSSASVASDGSTGSEGSGAHDSSERHASRRTAEREARRMEQEDEGRHGGRGAACLGGEGHNATASSAATQAASDRRRQRGSAEVARGAAARRRRGALPRQPFLWRHLLSQLACGRVQMLPSSRARPPGAALPQAAPRRHLRACRALQSALQRSGSAAAARLQEQAACAGVAAAHDVLWRLQQAALRARSLPVSAPSAASRRSPAAGQTASMERGVPRVEDVVLNPTKTCHLLYQDACWPMLHLLPHLPSSFRARDRRAPTAARPPPGCRRPAPHVRPLPQRTVAALVGVACPADAVLALLEVEGQAVLFLDRLASWEAARSQPAAWQSAGCAAASGGGKKGARHSSRSSEAGGTESSSGSGGSSEAEVAPAWWRSGGEGNGPHGEASGLCRLRSSEGFPEEGVGQVRAESEVGERGEPRRLPLGEGIGWRPRCWRRLGDALALDGTGEPEERELQLGTAPPTVSGSGSVPAANAPLPLTQALSARLAEMPEPGRRLVLRLPKAAAEQLPLEGRVKGGRSAFLTLLYDPIALVWRRLWAAAQPRGQTSVPPFPEQQSALLSLHGQLVMMQWQTSPSFCNELKAMDVLELFGAAASPRLPAQLAARLQEAEAAWSAPDADSAQQAAARLGSWAYARMQGLCGAMAPALCGPLQEVLHALPHGFGRSAPRRPLQLGFLQTLTEFPRPQRRATRGAGRQPEPPITAGLGPSSNSWSSTMLRLAVLELLHRCREAVQRVFTKRRRAVKRRRDAQDDELHPEHPHPKQQRSGGQVDAASKDRSRGPGATAGAAAARGSGHAQPAAGAAEVASAAAARAVNQASPHRGSAREWWTFVGIKQPKGCHTWKAQISFQGKQRHLGTFTSAAQAAAAYDAAVVKHCRRGNWLDRPLNFPEQYPAFLVAGAQLQARPVAAAAASAADAGRSCRSAWQGRMLAALRRMAQNPMDDGAWPVGGLADGGGASPLQCSEPDARGPHGDSRRAGVSARAQTRRLPRSAQGHGDAEEAISPVPSPEPPEREWLAFQQLLASHRRQQREQHAHRHAPAVSGRSAPGARVEKPTLTHPDASSLLQGYPTLRRARLFSFDPRCCPLHHRWKQWAKQHGLPKLPHDAQLAVQSAAEAGVRLSVLEGVVQRACGLMQPDSTRATAGGC